MSLLLLIESSKKSGWVAALLNLLIPGAGYMYCDRVLLGIVAFVFIMLVIVLSFGFLAFIFWPILIIDGFLCAERYNRDLVHRLMRRRR